ncbi:MAG: hypothetical protein ACLP6G_00030 [Terriglobales bacterium]
MNAPTGEDLFKWRNLVCLLLLATLPLSLAADDTGGAILHSSGSVLLNKNPVPSTGALRSDDLIETQSDAIARIELAGSAADMNPETMVQFNSAELILEHGSLSVNTSRGLKVRVGCVTVTPVRLEWTHYDVSDVDGKVTVAALKNDVYVESRSANAQPARQSTRSDRAIVREGEQKSRQEKCGGATLKESSVAGRGPIMSSPYVMWPAAGVIFGVARWVICCGDDAVSPDRP